MNTTVTEFNTVHIPSLTAFRNQLTPQKIFENSERDEYGDLDIYTYSPIHSFLSRLYRSNFILPNDQTEWLKQQPKDANVLEADYLPKADLEALRRIITHHIRKGKSREGHISLLFESGYFYFFLEVLEKWQ